MKKLRFFMVIMLLCIFISIQAWQPYSGYVIDGVNGNVTMTNMESIDDGTATLSSGALTGLTSVTATTFTDGTFSVTGGVVTGLAGIGIGSCTTGIDFNGTFGDAAIDLTDVTLNYGGSSGPVMIRAGTYGSPVTSSDSGQSGMIRLYGRNSALTDTEASGFYDRGLFVCLKGTGAKGLFPIAGLAEVEATVSGDGPTAVMASQFISHLTSTSSKLANTTGVNGMYAGWFKITAIDGATTGATSKKAAIWLDNQMYGNNAAPGEEYTIFATTGGLKPDAFVGFETTSSGFSNMWYFDETAYDQDPISDLGAKEEVNSDKSIKINLNGTTYYIPIFVVANME